MINLFKYILVLFVMINAVVTAQNNVFLDRAYWESQPTLSAVKKDIKAGNDPAELNRYAFDAVSWALIEKVDNKIVYHLLEQSGNGVNKLTHDARTYIFWAAYMDNIEVMQHLVDNGARIDIVDSHGYSLLNFAAVTGQKNPELYDFIIENGVDPLKEVNKDGANALLLVAPFLEEGELITYFTQKGISIHSTDNNGNGIFNYASRNITPDFLNILIERGVDYSSKSKKGENAFLFATQSTRGTSNTLEQYEFLEELGVDPNVVTIDGVNPLHNIAGSNKDVEIFEYFLNRDVQLDQENTDGITPFMFAARRNSKEIVRFLLPKVDNINHKDNDGKTALCHAVRYNSAEVIALLLKNDAQLDVVDKKGNTIAYYLVDSFDPADIEGFLAKWELLSTSGLDFKSIQSDQSNLWHHAVKKDNLQLLELVSALKIDISQRDSNGMTALHLAAMQTKHPEALKFLIEQGAKLSVKTDFDETAYDLAQENELLNRSMSDFTFLKP